MADFSFLSDSDDERAVQELLSQAMDQAVLEQVAKVNCSSFSDSVLPDHLETRFQKLKSFPSAESKPKCSSTRRHSASSSSSLSMKANKDKSSSFLGKDEIFSPSKKSPDGKTDFEKNSESGFHSSPEIWKFSSSKKAPDVGKLKLPDGKIGLEVKIPSDSSSNSSDSTMDSLSPPPRSGCFWFSPKGVPRKKSKENSILNKSLEWENNEEILSDLSNFSAKKQQKLLKKAIKEEEKISREAEKIVKWAKQASARMEVSSIEDELSYESFK